MFNINQYYAYSTATRLFAIACADTYSKFPLDYVHSLYTPVFLPDLETLDELDTNWRKSKGPANFQVQFENTTYQGRTWWSVQIYKDHPFESMTAIQIGKWVIFGPHWANLSQASMQPGPTAPVQLHHTS